ncbi:hypothetical protein AMATHDRAFT_142590 [Amanita thiersii Skay4041]|uniref:PX domain-containing protein n=1 Tax=Amanita thiersii Skay4041 TaxID=703135 RepID=A0A2A9NT07_9AGAR|nr:hypothetical protein AMATHDRAFT_142590 [Amanita thiersii Skay4041]
MATFDPLASSQPAFTNTDDVLNPPWPTTPHSPDAVPNLLRASPVPPTPDKGPSTGLYGREPQIYGQPQPGLISPRENIGVNGTKYEKLEPYLRVRITGLDRNRRDILIKLDAQTNLSNFTGHSYRNVSRSYYEFQQLYDAIFHSNPQTIIPALPLAQTSAPTDEEDDRLVKIMLQRWITRVCEDPILIHDEDLRSFIENDFGYQPIPRPRRKASSGFSLMRRWVPDEDEELQRARFELTKLEGLFFEAAKAVDKLSITRKSLASTHAEMGNRLINVATGEAHPPLANAVRKVGRTWHSLADLDHAQAISECVILGDSLGYQGMNARSAKDTLQMRTSVLEEYQAAVKVTISKRRQIERLKASSNIRPERVDEALEEMEEANKYEQVLARRAEGISQNLHRALQTHNRHANDDITAALIEHVRSSIMYERQLLRELEALRGDVDNAAKKALPSANDVPKPRIIPPLEDFSDQMPPPPSAPAANGFHRPPMPQYQTPPYTSGASDSFPRSVPPSTGQRTAPLSASSIISYDPIQGPLSPVSAQIQSKQPPTSPSLGVVHSNRPIADTSVKAAQSGPPLGGRFVDGTKSMFIQGSSAQHQPLTASSSTPSIADVTGPSQGPLQNQSTHSSYAVDPLGALASQPPTKQQQAANVDPLAHVKPAQMTSSLRLPPPNRPRLDPREAASKLANIF